MGNSYYDTKNSVIETTHSCFYCVINHCSHTAIIIMFIMRIDWFTAVKKGSVGCDIERLLLGISDNSFIGATFYVQLKSESRTKDVS